MQRNFRKLTRRYQKRELPTFVWVLIMLFSMSIAGILVFNFIALPLWVGVNEEITVPDVCGRPIEEAKNELIKAGLKFEIKAQQFSNLPKDIVISQYPLPARKVIKEKVVELSVSRGKEKIKIPWVEGMSLSQAQNLLKSAGLEIGEIIYEYSAQATPDNVIGTEPKIDAVVYKGSKVNIIVSQGEPETIAPNFIGMSLREVQEEAGKMGIVVEVKYVAKASPLGMIIIQKPPAGVTIKKGESLELTVGSPRKY
ncbi:MAG: PASTA domain-containing protein [bacterium]|nr:PASTA domain-containing protein [bacterium]